MSPQQADRVLLEAYERHKHGDIVNALALYRDVINAYPGNFLALGHAALAMRQLWALAKGTPHEFDHQKIMHLMLGAVETMASFVEGNPNVVPALRKHYAGVLFNYGKFQHDQGKVEGPDGAKAFYEAAVEQDPDLSEAWTNLGLVYGEAGNRMRAEAHWLRATQCSQVTAESRYNLSFYHLMRGDFAKGWREYEQRWDCVTFKSSYARYDLTTPRWTGEPVGRLFIHGEQGAGDIVQMARYLPLCRERCQTLIVEVLEPLVRLFEEALPGVQITARGSVAPEHDAQCPMMSLPMVFGTTLENIPQPLRFPVKTA